MKKDPNRYTREPNNFIGGVVGMGPAVIGTYAVILELLYISDGKLQRDDVRLSQIMGCSKRKAAALTDQLIGCGKLVYDGSYLTNKKATKILSKKEQFLRFCSDSGKKSAEIRSTSNKINDLDSRYVEAARAREIDLTKTNKLKDKIPPPTPPTPPRGASEVRPWMTQIDERAPLENADEKFALDLGWNSEMIAEQFERFKNHHRSKGNFKQDWSAAWRLWCTDPIRKRENGSPQQKPQTDNLTGAISYLETARKAMPGGE